jgi:hypothetical protein
MFLTVIGEEYRLNVREIFWVTYQLHNTESNTSKNTYGVGEREEGTRLG